MPLLRIPVMDAPSQRMGLVLNGRRVTLTLNYNKMLDRWSFDLAIDTAPVLHGRRIVLGIDLLAPFNLGLGQVIAVDYEGKGADPGYSELVTGRARLLQADPAVVAEIVALMEAEKAA